MIDENEALEDNSQDIDINDPPPTDKPEKTLRETIEEAAVQAKEPKEEKQRNEDGKFKAKEKLKLDPAKSPAIEVVAKEIPAPAAWKNEHKAKWNDLPQDIREEISRREDEVHKGFTKLDEDRNLGKQIKEVVTPYLATIRAEGGTPVTAVADLLNTAHVLRTGDPLSKARMVQNVIKQFGIDLSLVQGNQQQIDPTVTALQQQLAQINYEREQEKLLQRQEQDGTVNAIIEEFAANPANIYYAQVKPQMAALLKASLATDLQDAYDKAVKLDPSISQIIVSQTAAELATKKQQELEAKRRAAVSVSGSSSTHVANATNPNRTLREELEANFRSASID